MKGSNGTISWYDEIPIFALWNLAVAQPLFELLSRNAEFFVFQGTTRYEIIVFTGLLSFFFPAALSLLLRFLKKMHYQASLCVRILLITLLIACTILPGVRASLKINGYLLIGLITTLSFGVAVGYFRFDWLRTFFLFLAPAILIVPIVFLRDANIQKLLAAKEPLLQRVEIPSPHPVILIVYDELPLISLLDENGNIDEHWFPNFSHFAREAIWYRNATTVASNTSFAVPAILTGKNPGKDRLPIIGDHPQNLFTALAGTYDLHVLETLTRLCPEGVTPDPSDKWRLFTHSKDLSTVYFHLILPIDLSLWLPPITNAWGNFGSDNNGKSNTRDPITQFTSFLKSISPSTKPTLYFLHSDLPHSPWQVMPSGKTYSSTALDRLFVRHERWPSEQTPVINAYQRHLLQIAHSDKNFGKLISKLKQHGIYDRSLIVVTSDHGVSFQSGDFRRIITDRNYPEIINVPLFIKLPGSNTGKILDWNVETTDILPTMLDVLDVSIPWKMDGVSVLNNPPARERKKVWNFHRNEWLYFEPHLKATEFVHRKRSLFGTELPVTNMELDATRHWIGKSISSLKTSSSDHLVHLFSSDDLKDVNLNSDYLPLFIMGRIQFRGAHQGQMKIGIAVNGEVGAVTETFEFTKTSQAFGALIPESSLQNGINQIQIIEFIETGKDPVILPMDH